MEANRTLDRACHAAKRGILAHGFSVHPAFAAHLSASTAVHTVDGGKTPQRYHPFLRRTPRHAPLQDLLSRVVARGPIQPCNDAAVWCAALPRPAHPTGSGD